MRQGESQAKAEAGKQVRRLLAVNISKNGGIEQQSSAGIKEEPTGFPFLKKGKNQGLTPKYLASATERMKLPLTEMGKTRKIIIGR